jgi:hypothetical protein
VNDRKGERVQSTLHGRNKDAKEIVKKISKFRRKKQILPGIDPPLAVVCVTCELLCISLPAHVWLTDEWNAQYNYYTRPYSPGCQFNV